MTEVILVKGGRQTDTEERIIEEAHQEILEIEEVVVTTAQADGVIGTGTETERGTGITEAVIGVEIDDMTEVATETGSVTMTETDKRRKLLL